MILRGTQAIDPYVDRLESIGVTTTEEFFAVSEVGGRALSRWLGVDIATLAAQMPAGASSIPQSALTIIRQASYELGVDLDHVKLPSSAVAAAPLAAPPATVNLVPGCSPIRDQQNRGTCVSFASLSAYEHMLNVAGAGVDLSEQFLYWNCKRNDNHPGSGTWLGVAFPALARDGVCTETRWGYVGAPIQGNEGQNPPPAGSVVEALRYRPLVSQLSPTNVPSLKAELAAGRCIAFSVPVFPSWHGSSHVAYAGDITLPIPGEARSGGHAMCLVGYVDEPAKVAWGGGRFILRNSWGASWGIQSPYGAGYGTIPYRYLASYGAEAWTVG